MSHSQRPPDHFEVLHRTLTPFYIPNREAATAKPEPILPDTFEPQPLRVIGRGTCGTIYSSANISTVAYKIGRDKLQLWNDVQITTRVHRAVKEVRSKVEEALSMENETRLSIPRVPAIKGWVEEKDRAAFWQAHAGSFAGFREQFGQDTPYIFALSLIPTIPTEARNALISHFNFTAPKARAWSDPANRFCIIRPYLGLESREDQALCRADNLWNFPLTLEDFGTLGMTSGVSHLASEMAAGLAIVHWHAGNDGMDIEFVLGEVKNWDDSTSEIDELKGEAQGLQPFQLASRMPIDFERRTAGQSPQHSEQTPVATSPGGRCTQLYVLDFDKTTLLSFSRPNAARAIQRLVTAVTSNDPYFPDPAGKTTEQKELWETFKAAYLKTADLLLENLVQRYGRKAKSWPSKFIKEWEYKAEELVDGRDGSFVEFGY